MHCTVNVNEQECEKQEGAERKRGIFRRYKRYTREHKVLRFFSDQLVFVRAGEPVLNGETDRIEGMGSKRQGGCVMAKRCTSLFVLNGLGLGV